MKVLLSLAVLVGVALAAPIAIAPRGGVVIPGEFIVTIDSTINSGMTMNSLELTLKQIIEASNGVFLHRFEHTVNGYAIRVNDNALPMLRALNGVQIEANLVQTAYKTCEDQAGATWGLVRVSEHELKLDGHFFYSDVAGEGVDAYIIDTGIYTENEEFEGRAVWGTDTVDNPSPKTDSNGHGTHVAGTVLGKTYGLAKKATAIAVKVLGANGSGSTAGVIAGMDWAVKHHKSKTNGKPSTANMSLGGGYSSAMNDAADRVVEAGIALAVAAGNENQNACNVSPASASKPLIVGATDKTDTRSYFSNYGKCVKIFAPGSDITSSWIGGKTATKTISGTSMATPHVVGVLTRYRAAHPEATVEEVYQALLDTATKDAISDVKTGSPNKFLYAACEY